MAGRNLDFTFQFGSKLMDLPYLFRTMVVANDTNVASRYNKSKKAMNKNVQAFLKIFYE